jgi:hypothetical protein
LFQTAQNFPSRCAKKNEREFFAESFAIYEKVGILDNRLRAFIEECVK